MIPDIHPNIRKFWEKAGHSVYDGVITHTGERAWVIVRTLPPSIRGIHCVVAYIPQGTDSIRYLIDGQEYEEKVAIRVIKLTAFL